MKTTLEILKNQIPKDLLPKKLDSNATQLEQDVYNKHFEYLLQKALVDFKSPFLRSILFQIVSFDADTIPENVSMPDMIISKDIIRKYLLELNDDEVNDLWNKNKSLTKPIAKAKEYGLFD